MLSVNFRTFPLFLRIPEICCLLILNSSAKFVAPFSPFSKGEIIVCMSFVKRTDRFRFVMVINCFIYMTASFYSIAKACIWQSKYKTTSTNNNLEKFSYITNSESRIFIQEETNFITNMMFLRIHYQFYAFWRWFLVKVRYYSIAIRLIWLINACLCTEYLLHWKRKWISSSTLL